MSEEPIELVEVQPGIYSIKPEDPHAHQWQAFWRSIRILLIGAPIVMILGWIFD